MSVGDIVHAYRAHIGTVTLILLLSGMIYNSILLHQIGVTLSATEARSNEMDARLDQMERALGMEKFPGA